MTATAMGASSLGVAGAVSRQALERVLRPGRLSRLLLLLIDGTPGRDDELPERLAPRDLRPP